MTMRNLRNICMMFCCSLCMFLHIQAEDEVAVEGYVYGDDGTQIQDANFRLMMYGDYIQEDIISDEQGRIYFTIQEPGVYQLQQVQTTSGYRINHANIDIEVTFEEDVITLSDIINEKMLGDVTIHVIDEEDAPISDLELNVLDEQQQVIKQVTTDGDGAFVLEQLPLGSYMLKQTNQFHQYTQKQEVSVMITAENISKGYEVSVTFPKKKEVESSSQDYSLVMFFIFLTGSMVGGAGYYIYKEYGHILF